VGAADAAAGTVTPSAVGRHAGADGPAVPHGSRVKVRLTLHDGHAVDRLPAWARRAVAPPGQMGARFDGVHWAPPQHEQHRWCGPVREAVPPAELTVRHAHLQR
jgi:1,4-alpha-glucan branching enzyme